MMTRRQLAGGLAAFACALAMTATAFAADVTGKWKGEFQSPDGQSITNEFTFEVKGETLTGTVVSSRSPQPAPIEDATLKGDDIAFTVTRNFDGNAIKLRYAGTVKGDELPLKVSIDAGGQSFDFEILAKRQK
jgi:hypothetical protein